MSLLADREPRDLKLKCPDGLTADALYLGKGAMALEVVVLSGRKPNASELRATHAERLGRRATPLVLVARWGSGRASLCASTGVETVVVPDVDVSQAERIANALLDAPDRHAASRLIASHIGRLEDPIPGLRNSGLFALHELQNDVPTSTAWPAATQKARKLLSLRGKPLVESLGYSVQAMQGPESILVAKGTKVALALFLDRADEIEPASPQFGNVSPVSHALAKADQENLDYVVISAGATLRVYPVKPGIGTGRRGRTETFIELNLDLLPPDSAGYLWLLCSAEALASAGSFESTLAKSKDYAIKLGTRLRQRVYEEVVPALAKAIVKARKLRNPTPEKLKETYEMALQVLFRLLFVAYAEDKELLPLNQSKAYREHSLKQKATLLAESIQKGIDPGAEDFDWKEVQQLWKAVDKGNKDWGVPAYNGGLFSTDTAVGAALAKLSIPDANFRPALAALLVDVREDGVPAPVDFRSLGVREFGTIYEGLLESELSVAETALAVDKKTDAYIPAKGKATVIIAEGEVYLHNASGARKSSGAYYTKDFAVEHLLDHALEPALDDHLARLDAVNDDRTAAERFFEFRVADIAMGSGHFLVAAIDRIERRLSNYLAKRPLAGVRDELSRLRKTAQEALGEEWSGEAIEDTRLLRRQVARRCVYGVDLNPLAVELARLSIWIHTFVPGLPLSFLDGNLVQGSSLVGIATLREARELLVSEDDLFAGSADDLLAGARGPLERLARLSEATAAEVKQAKELHAAALDACAPAHDLLTVLAASRIDEAVQEAVESRQVSTEFRGGKQGDVFSDGLVRRAEKALSGLSPLHFPTVFPQVFLGARGGFDVILGNPPWEEATAEEDAFWARHFPGLRALPQREQEALKKDLRKKRPDLVHQHEKATQEAEILRKVLVTGPFPGMGTGDPDLYKAFCWRFWQLVSPQGGQIGVVLPRTALSAKGTTEFRIAVFANAHDVSITSLLNNRQWVFDEVHPQYTIGLVTIKRGSGADPLVKLRGPYISLAAYRAQVREPAAQFYGSVIRTWNDVAAIPLLPSEESAGVFQQLRQSPRLDLDDAGSWRVRPQAELHATNDKALMDLKSEERPDGYWPVYKGESFNIWEPDTGRYYAWADPTKVKAALQKKRLRAASGKNSAVAELGAAWLANERTLPCNSPRIVFRDVANRTDTRTIIPCLVPRGVFLTNKAPYLLFSRGSQSDTAFLLGVLSSRPLDWYARRYVELNVNFFIFNPLPIPRPPSDHPLRQRVIAISALLAGQHHALTTWAKGVGRVPVRLTDAARAAAIAELDAAVAHLYGLTESHLRHVFETFQEGWDSSNQLSETLASYQALKDLA